MNDREIRKPDLRDLSAMSDVLARDYDYCHLRLDGDESGFYRRALTRTVCALAEGFGSIMRKHALTLIDGNGRLDAGRFAVLRGVTYRATDDGEIEEAQLRTPTLKNICVAFRWYAEAWGSPHRLDKDCEGWQALNKTFEIRDRITHPEQASDLEITDSEALVVKKAYCYLLSSLMHLYDQSALVAMGPCAE